MSRIGNNPISIPEGVSVNFDNNVINVKGKLGELVQEINSNISVNISDNEIVFSRSNDQKENRSLHGLYRALVSNMIIGVSDGFTKKLELIGVGYQANMQGKYLVLQLGFSHDIYFEPPEGIDIKTNRTEITVSGINKQLVGEVAAKIRSFRKPEPYKGKGVRYKDEYVRSKQGKTVGGTA